MHAGSRSASAVLRDPNASKQVRAVSALGTPKVRPEVVADWAEIKVELCWLSPIRCTTGLALGAALQ
jgi:hypothetical protein